MFARLFTAQRLDGVGEMSVVIGLPDFGTYDWPALRRRARRTSPAVSVRPFEWRKIGRAAASTLFRGAKLPLDASVVRVPDDGASAFRDADGWFFMGSHTSASVAWLRPTAVYCADLLPRRVSAANGGYQFPGDRGLLAETMIAWRQAECVFATTPTSRDDAVTYAGVPPDRALLTPLQTERIVAPVDPAVVGSDPAILWVTNNASHKNHRAAVAALRRYVAAGGSLSVKVAGFLTKELDPATGSDHEGARAFAAAPEVLARTTFVGEPGNEAFAAMMAASGIVWHNVLADNGTLTSFDAVHAGAHLVSSDYPPQRYTCERHGIEAIWHPARDPDAAAAALLEAERRLRQGQPPRHALRETTDEELRRAYAPIIARLANA
ncbi:glycosyltransferase family protein [Falsiroseomonas oryziterrae]|uniref:hypothetical protein n=1 Tax=Falsiroseomonas oryziterrae TaxID=2911368 RepID=UPI001F472931|nr:hypothetical protein [Roseomonas sp. NPKOSM-4]